MALACLHVRTPGDRLIHDANRGPDADTEYGELDRDEVTGTGPESVFWANGQRTPVGGYRVHLMAVGRPEVVYTGALTQPPTVWGCNWGDPAVASFGIP